MDLPRHRDDRLVVGDVGRLPVADRPAGGADLRDDALQRLGLDVGQVEVGALRRGGERGRPADPAGGAGDEAALAAQVADPDRRAAS